MGLQIEHPVKHRKIQVLQKGEVIPLPRVVQQYAGVQQGVLHGPEQHIGAGYGAVVRVVYVKHGAQGAVQVRLILPHIGADLHAPFQIVRACRVAVGDAQRLEAVHRLPDGDDIVALSPFLFIEIRVNG